MSFRVSWIHCALLGQMVGICLFLLADVTAGRQAAAGIKK
jgi:hypothetical protein